MKDRQKIGTSNRVRVGVDTGGTFTDFVFEVKGRLQIFKLASTPADPSLAITEGLRRLAEITSVTLGDVEVVHGTTVGTNALLQRRGARAALASLNIPLSISHQVLPEYREFERTSTVAINAYLQPLMGRYLNRLVEPGSAGILPASAKPSRQDAGAPRFSLRVMQSSGGSISATAAAAEPVR